MAIQNVSLLLALGAGFLSFFSPCVLPLIPVYIMYITGTSVESELSKKRLLAITRTIGFVIGFTIIFMIMGTSASFLGKIFIRNREIFSKISGIIIIVFGLNMLGVLKINFLQMEKKLSAPSKVTNWFSSILMGMAFAAGWTPCFGPVLGSILIYASAAGTVMRGVILLLVYSLGMAIPFILTAVFIGSFRNVMKKFSGYLEYLPKISGVVLIIFGVIMFFDKISVISGFFS
ncbi:cytochrome c biogenesis CcdA family protein [Clostridium sp. DL1XJH146]